MENVIQIFSEENSHNNNDEDNQDLHTRRIPVFQYEGFPLDYNAIPIPRCNTGYVYFLVSSKDTTKTYIGQTMDLLKRINQHNSGYNTDFTNQIDLQPWLLYAFITGFDQNRTLMLSIEHNWQAQRLYEFENSTQDPKNFARSVRRIIPTDNNISLRFMLCFN